MVRDKHNDEGYEEYFRPGYNEENQKRHEQQEALRRAQEVVQKRTVEAHPYRSVSIYTVVAVALTLGVIRACAEYVDKETERAAKRAEDERRDARIRNSARPDPKDVERDMLELAIGLADNEVRSVEQLAPEQLRLTADDFRRFMMVCALASQDRISQETVATTSLVRKAKRIYEQPERVLDSFSDREQRSYDSFFEKTMTSIPPGHNLSRCLPHLNWDQAISYAYGQLGLDVNVKSPGLKDRAVIFLFEKSVDDFNAPLEKPGLRLADTVSLYASPAVDKAGSECGVPYRIAIVNRALKDADFRAWETSLPKGLSQTERQVQLDEYLSTHPIALGFVQAVRPLPKDEWRQILDAIIGKQHKAEARSDPGADGTQSEN